MDRPQLRSVTIEDFPRSQDGWMIDPSSINQKHQNQYYANIASLSRFSLQDITKSEANILGVFWLETKKTYGLQIPI